MRIPGPRSPAVLALLAALTLASMAGCREKHEPVKPTVAMAQAQR